MKKRIIVGSGLIVVIIAVVLIIVLSGKGSVEANRSDISGVWFVFNYGDTSVDNEYMYFDNGQVDDYRDGKLFAQSTYTFEENTLNMPKISKEFVVREKSKNVIVLVEPNTIEWKLVYVADTLSEVSKVNAKDIVGEYNVETVAGEKRVDETMNFSEKSFFDTRDGKKYIESDYSIEADKHLLHAKGINKDYLIYQNGSTLILVDYVDRYVWELTKK